MARKIAPGGRVVSFPKAGPPPAARRTKIAVTGGAGFFGSRLVRSLLLRGEHEVVVFDLVPPADMPGDVRHRFLDLNLPFADGTLYKLLLEEKPDVIVHLAQLRSPSRQTTYAHELNSIGALHVFAAAGEAKVPRVILGSMSLVYGARGDNPNFLTEEHPLRPDPQDRFVQDFVEAEKHAREHVRRHPETARPDPALRAAPVAGGPRLPRPAVRVALRVDAHGLRPARAGAAPRRRRGRDPLRARPPGGARRVQRGAGGHPADLDASASSSGRSASRCRTRSRTRSTRRRGSPASASCRGVHAHYLRYLCVVSNEKARARPRLRAEEDDAGLRSRDRARALRQRPARGLRRAREGGEGRGLRVRAPRPPEARGPAHPPGGRLVSARRTVPVKPFVPVSEAPPPSGGFAPSLLPQKQDDLLQALLGEAARFLDAHPEWKGPRAAVDLWNLFRHRNRTLSLDDFGYDEAAAKPWHELFDFLYTRLVARDARGRREHPVRRAPRSSSSTTRASSRGTARWSSAGSCATTPPTGTRGCSSSTCSRRCRSCSRGCATRARSAPARRTASAS